MTVIQHLAKHDQLLSVCANQLTEWDRLKCTLSSRCGRACE